MPTKALIMNISAAGRECGGSLLKKLEQKFENDGSPVSTIVKGVKPAPWLVNTLPRTVVKSFSRCVPVDSAWIQAGRHR